MHLHERAQAMTGHTEEVVVDASVAIQWQRAIAKRTKMPVELAGLVVAYQFVRADECEMYVPVAHQRLVFAGKQLEDERSLAAYSTSSCCARSDHP